MVNNAKTFFAICALAFAGATTISAQSLSDSTIKKIDGLFRRWNGAGSPGCTVGIIRNDSLIFSRGYGMANLEYGIPNEPQTLFHMASISKQFAGFAVILLARQHKLNLEDDIHKWLPWFPDLKERITIQNLLNHTSGIRDQWQLLAISGTRLDDVITQDQIIKILSKQQALNFKPGDKFSYSNSGFTMLAEIVKAVSGQSLRQFTDSAIFRPLGMTSTHIHDDYTELEKNRSYSYYRKDSTHFRNAVLSYSVSGATSLFTNINDMSKWVMNFNSHLVGDRQDIELLTQKGKLNGGKEFPYARGMVNNTWRGWRQYSHGGSDAGYRTYIAVFPDLKTGFLLFSNLGDFDAAGKVYEMAALLIKDTTTGKVAVTMGKRDSAAAVLKDTAAVKKFTGSYTGEEGLLFSFDTRNSQLHYHVFGESNFLIRDTKDSFSIPESPQVKFVFAVTGKDTTVDIITPDEMYHLKKFVNDTAQPDDLLRSYTGRYYCPELDCSYGIVLKDHQLFLANSKYNDAKLTLSGRDHLMDDNWWMNHLEMLRDTNDNIVGFEVNSGRIMHLKFNKIK